MISLVISWNYGNILRHVFFQKGLGWYILRCPNFLDIGKNTSSTRPSINCADKGRDVAVCTRIYSISLFPYLFFSIWVFFHNHSRITGRQEKGEGISLTSHYHFHPLHRHLDISRAITAESSLLHICSIRIQTGNLWFLCTRLTIKLIFFSLEMKMSALLSSAQTLFYLLNFEIIICIDKSSPILNNCDYKIILISLYSLHFCLRE